MLQVNRLQVEKTIEIHNMTKGLQNHGGLGKGAKLARNGMGRRSRAGFDTGSIRQVLLREISPCVVAESFADRQTMPRNAEEQAQRRERKAPLEQCRVGSFELYTPNDGRKFQ